MYSISIGNIKTQAVTLVNTRYLYGLEAETSIASICSVTFIAPSSAPILEPTLPALKFNKTPRPKEITKEELQKYVGGYESNGITAKVYVKDDKILYILVPGQPDYELVPVDKNKFAIKVISGYYIQFEMNDKGESTDLTFIQPNGNFKAKKN